ncbi:MAG: hypothetical protein JO310_09995, partial [Hyphomicrobiales bacterium]|nr:hypothetical protein [Hyphomicrobiales bacterium]
MPLEPRRVSGPFARMRTSLSWRSDRSELWRYIGWRLIQLAIVLIGVS